MESKFEAMDMQGGTSTESEVRSEPVSRPEPGEMCFPRQSRDTVVQPPPLFLRKHTHPFFPQAPMDVDSVWSSSDQAVKIIQMRVSFTS